MPDTPLITSAIKYARESSEPCLFNHVMRSWLFAVSLAQLNQTAHDGEVLAVAGGSDASNNPALYSVRLHAAGGESSAGGQKP